MDEMKHNAPTIETEFCEPLSVQAYSGVSTLPNGRDSALFSRRKGGELALEELRLLQARLGELWSQRPFKRLLITSAVQGEGKTSVAANLAFVLAKEGHQKVLLMDVDIRNPHVHLAYGIDNKCGLKDCLVAGHQPSAAITKIQGMELYIMPSGRLTCDSLSPTSILKLKALLDQLEPAYDVILLDSSPLLATTDTKLISKVVDACLLVVGVGTTPRSLVTKAMELLGDQNILGAVLNRVEAKGTYYSASGPKPIIADDHNFKIGSKGVLPRT